MEWQINFIFNALLVQLKIHYETDHQCFQLIHTYLKQSTFRYFFHPQVSCIWVQLEYCNLFKYLLSYQIYFSFPSVCILQLLFSVKVLLFIRTTASSQQVTSLFCNLIFCLLIHKQIFIFNHVFCKKLLTLQSCIFKCP